MKRNANGLRRVLVPVLLILGCVCATHTAVAEAGRLLPSPEVETLSSGIRVVWFSRPELPLVDLIWVFEGGSRSEPPNRAGVAALAASLLTRGTRTHSEQQISELLDLKAAGIQANVDDDYLTLSGNALSQDVDLILSLSIEMLFDRAIDPVQLERRRSLMSDQWLQLRESPQSLVGILMGRALSIGTPYQGKGRLSLAELRALKRSDVESYLDGQIRPERATLVIAGQFDRVHLRSLLEQTHAKAIPASPKVHRTSTSSGWLPRVAPGRKPMIAIIDRADRSQAQIALGWQVTPAQSLNRVPLALANTVIGDLFSSRLNLRIRDELGLTYGVSSSVNYRKQSGDWTISTATRNDQVGHVLSEIVKEMKKLQEFGLTSEELDRAKTYTLGAFPLSVASLPAIASRWLQTDLFGLGRDFYQGSESEIQSVSLDQVNRVLRSQIQIDRAWTMVGGDAKEIKSGLKQYHFNDLESVRPTELIR